MNSDDSLQSNPNNIVEETNWPDDPITSEQSSEVEKKIPPTSATPLEAEFTGTEFTETESHISIEPETPAPTPANINPVEPEMAVAEAHDAALPEAANTHSDEKQRQEDVKSQEVTPPAPEPTFPETPIAEIPQEPQPETASEEEIQHRQLLLENIEQLETEKETLITEIKALKAEKAKLLADETLDVEAAIRNLVMEGTRALEEKKQNLTTTIEKLERRQARIEKEMRTTFSGASQDLAIQVKGFKDYLVGSLQDLTAAAEKLQVPKRKVRERPQRQPESYSREREPATPPPSANQLAAGAFQQQTRKIRHILERYRTSPDYYGPSWQLRRTFEPIHAERVQEWFFKQGGRGTIRSMGSRLQNILIGSAIIAVLYQLYGERSRTLILADSPERLGEWRRGLQDCLGLSRHDFGPERGIVLFESPQAVVQKAERLSEQRQMPLVIFDEGENQVNLSLLQFPLWLAFTPDPQQMSNYYF